MKGGYMLYKKVKALCDKQGISIRECENRAGLGNATIAGWKREDIKPEYRTVSAVAKVLEVPLDVLMENSNEGEG